MRYLTSIQGEDGVGAAVEKLEMKDSNQCELSGARWIATKRVNAEQRASFNFVCLEGK